MSTSHRSEKVAFLNAGVFGGIRNKMEIDHVKHEHLEKNKLTEIQCFTLYSLLLALQQMEIDYFSLDVEGAELYIMETIPFDKLKINVMSIEYRVINNKDKTLKKLEMIRNFFKTIGNYTEVGILPLRAGQSKKQIDQAGLDVIFKRN